MGYDYEGIASRTPAEVNALQLGFIVRQEEQEAAMAAAESAGGSYSDQRKRQHDQSIRRRLRQMDVEKERRNRGRVRRAREHFAEERDL